MSTQTPAETLLNAAEFVRWETEPYLFAYPVRANVIIAAVYSDPDQAGNQYIALSLLPSDRASDALKSAHMPMRQIRPTIAQLMHAVVDLVSNFQAEGDTA